MAQDIQVGPATQDLFLYAGDDFEFYFRLYGQVFDTVTGKMIKGDPLDLDGYSFLSQCRALETDTDPLFSFTVTPSNQATLDSRGFILVSLTAAETRAALPAGQIGNEYVKIGVWDFQLTEPSTKVSTIWAGSVSVRSDVTR